MNRLLRLWRVITAHRPAAIATALVAVAVVLGLWAKAEAYVSGNANFCTHSCHTGEIKHATKLGPGHPKIACQACHTGGRHPGLGLVFKGLFGIQSNVARHAALDETTCVSCHSTRPNAQQVADTQGHRQHGGPRQPVACLKCHGVNIHGGPSTAVSCTNCHAASKLHAQVADGDNCLSCHNFSVTSSKTHRLTIDDCGRCHGDDKSRDPSVPNSELARARRVTPGMLHGSVDCKLCHQPHRRLNSAPLQPAANAAPVDANAADTKAAITSDAARGLVAQQPCNRCHEIQMGPDSDKVPLGHVRCAQCHRQHAPLQEARVACSTCHVQGRSDSNVGSQGRRHRSCTSCHAPHTWIAQRSGCVQCHDAKAQSLLTRSPEAHQSCTKCHEIHGSYPDQNACVKCHKNRLEHIASAPASHKNCVGCHDPHAASNPDRKICIKCHADQVRLLVNSGPAGHAAAGCLGCHAPHGNPKAPAQASCKNCHADKAQHVAEAGPEPHKRCVSCHQPHRFIVTSPEAACTNCHKATIAADSIHRGPCTKCHLQHGSPSITATMCLGCHESIGKSVGANTPHSRCRNCHQPHVSSKVAPKQCATCHQDKARVAALWPAGSAHAGPCINCHQNHQVTNIKTCDNCHAAEATAAKGRPHKCSFCHQPHKDPAPTRAGWWERCANCHKSELSAVQSGPHRDKCQTCHKPHAFSLPTCTDCHKSIPSQGAHSSTGHRKCTACHDPHTASKPERDKCVACHQDRRTHMPDVQRCNTCHIFR